jgi:hypothetical protein
MSRKYEDLQKQFKELLVLVETQNNYLCLLEKKVGNLRQEIEDHKATIKHVCAHYDYYIYEEHQFNIISFECERPKIHNRESLNSEGYKYVYKYSNGNELWVKD